MENPAGHEPRRMQMSTEVGAERNATTILMVPGEGEPRNIHISVNELL